VQGIDPEAYFYPAELGAEKLKGPGKWAIIERKTVRL
jgi:hypothetical protein